MREETARNIIFLAVFLLAMHKIIFFFGIFVGIKSKKENVQ